MQAKRKNPEVGLRFEKLTVLRITEPRVFPSAPEGRSQVIVKCDCGTEKTVLWRNLTAGLTLSCGCLHKERMADFNKKNALHGDTNTVEFTAWTSMIARCHTPTHRAFKDYGGRGISVCDSWRKSYLCFLADVGRKPNPLLTLDRIDNDGNYEPGNCRWATRKEQRSNQRPAKYKNPNWGRRAPA